MNKHSKILVDGDILVYRTGFACQKEVYSLWARDEDGSPHFLEEIQGKKPAKERALEFGFDVDIEFDRIEVEPVENALHSIKLLLEHMQGLLGGDLHGYLTGSGNYRNDVYPNYKANRADVPRPELYNNIRDYLIHYWNAEVVNGMEADDALGINQDDTSVIATIDKDLDTVTGWHYNWVKDEYYHVDEQSADYAFFLQMLTGDNADNICGLRGVGPARAKKILDKEQFPAEAAVNAYIEYYGEGWHEAWECNEKLLWILTDAP